MRPVAPDSRSPLRPASPDATPARNNVPPEKRALRPEDVFGAGASTPASVWLPILLEQTREQGLPAWYPADYDLKAAAARARAVLARQGEPLESIDPHQVDRLLFCDADHTFLQTHTPLYLRHRETGERLRLPSKSGGLPRLVQFGAPGLPSLKELQERHSAVDWGRYETDFTDYNSIKEILNTEEITPTLDTLRASDADPRCRDFIITARSGEAVPAGLDEFQAARAVDSNGVFAVNNPEQNAVMGLPEGVTPPQKKAFAMAALISLYDAPGAPLQSVKFLDDADDNLQSSIELLPQLFPHIRFEFIDVVRNADGQYTQVPIHTTGPAVETFFER